VACSGTVQRKALGQGAGFLAPASSTEALRSPGVPLEPKTRATMEAGFGHDFSRVRIHVDDTATRALSARAFTLGHDVVFASREWSKKPDRLLAHELAHVVQQEGHVVPPQAALEVGPTDDPAERAADAAADRVVHGQRATVAPLSAPIVRRAPTPAREAEIATSLTSPGQFTASVSPPSVSIYNFAIDHGLLKPEHKRVVKEIHNLLDLGVPGGVKVRVVGHADDSGDASHNVALSKLRAREAQGELGKPVDSIVGMGDTQPVLANDTAVARNRNRRVDFFFEPGPVDVIKKKKKRKKKPEDEKKKTKEDDDDDDWDIPNPCAGTIAPYLCGVIGVGVVCAFLPEVCLFTIPWPFHWPKIPWPKKKPKDKDKDKDPPPRARACPIHVNLPSGAVTVRDYRPTLQLVDAPFKMRASFENDDQTGCVCACGEYRQYVRGFFETDQGTGTWKDDPHEMGRDPKTPGKFVILDRTTFQEDGHKVLNSYGHRDTFGSPSNDLFLTAPSPLGKKDRFGGCFYEGTDAPGVTLQPGVQHRFHLEFKGVVVDHCNGDEPKRSSEWTVDWPPKPPPPPPPQPSPPTHTTLPDPPRMGPATGDYVPIPFDPNKQQISSEAFSYAQAHGSRGVEGDALARTILLEYRALAEWYDRTQGSDDRTVALKDWAMRRIRAWKAALPPPAF
jgi:outer membrane protein OmpA-like peptidoglycan-associated protein